MAFVYMAFVDVVVARCYNNSTMQPSRLPGEKIYKRLKSRLKGHKGEIVAIDPKTGRYILGEDELAVALRARQEYPGTCFSFFRIGYPAIHKFRRQE